MSIVLEILKELWNTELNYKGIPVNIFGIPRLSSYKTKSLQNSVYQLRDGKYIEKGSNGWNLTNKGKMYYKDRLYKLQQFTSPFEKKAPKNLILIYDIPEEKKREREWFRTQLKKFEYKMIQRSVWVGPSPLPRDFSNYLKKINIKKQIKTFKLSKPYNF